MFNLPHAEAHAVILLYSMAFNQPAVPAADERLCKALETQEAAAALHDLGRSPDAPASLDAPGLRSIDIRAAATAAMQAPYYNPRALSQEAVHRLLAYAFDGTRPESRTFQSVWFASPREARIRRFFLPTLLLSIFTFMDKRALIIGATGIVGGNLAQHLLACGGWKVSGLSRGRTKAPDGVESVTADLTSAKSVKDALQGQRFSHVYFSAWSRQATERENIEVNGAMVRHVLDALGPSGKLEHAALVTGLKHYLGPFEAYAQGNVPLTPFREEQGRQPVDNFYYEQEDRLFEAARRHDFSWSVHRPHTIIGFALGNAMNMGVTLAVYATLCKETGQPFVFPGSVAQWNSLTDMTDARLLARHLEWASTSPGARNEDFNVVNGDVFRWKWMWSQLAQYFGIDPAPFDGETRPLEHRMLDAKRQWADIAGRYQLKEPDIDRLVSWWHTDADLGRPMEVLTDMSKSRKAGFLDYQPTSDAFFALFDKLKRERIIPS